MSFLGGLLATLESFSKDLTTLDPLTLRFTWVGVPLGFPMLGSTNPTQHFDTTRLDFNHSIKLSWLQLRDGFPLLSHASIAWGQYQVPPDSVPTLLFQDIGL